MAMHKSAPKPFISVPRKKSVCIGSLAVVVMLVDLPLVLLRYNADSANLRLSMIPAQCFASLGDSSSLALLAS